MSKIISTNSAKYTFAQVNTSTSASDYIERKKRSQFCNPGLCYPNKKAYSQSNLMMMNKVTYYAGNPYYSFNKNQLYSNLYTKLDLSDLSGNTPIISDLSGNTFPVIIDVNSAPYLNYNIDPSGVLFGTNPCTLNNYLDYVVHNDNE